MGLAGALGGVVAACVGPPQMTPADAEHLRAAPLVGAEGDLKSLLRSEAERGQCLGGRVEQRPSFSVAHRHKLRVGAQRKALRDGRGARHQPPLPSVAIPANAIRGPQLFFAACLGRNVRGELLAARLRAIL